MGLDLGRWLKDRKNEAVNTWQNSVVLDAVSANTQADQARRVQAGQPAQYKDQQGSQNLVNRVRDVLDANSQVDQQKRIANNQPRFYADQQREMGLRPRDNIAEQFLGGTAQLVNTSAARLREIPETVRGTTAQVTGNMDALNASLKRQDGLRNKLYSNSNAGLFGSGTIYDNTEEAKNLGVADTAKRIGGGLAETASLVIGGPVVGKVGAQAFKQGTMQGIKQIATKETAANLAKLSAGGALGSGGYELNANTNATPLSVATQAGVGAVAGPVLGVAAFGAGKVAGKALRPVADKITSIVKERPILKQTGIPAAPGSLREKIQLAKDSIVNSKLASNEDGFVKVPGSKEVPELPKRTPEVLPKPAQSQSLSDSLDNSSTGLGGNVPKEIYHNTSAMGASDISKNGFSSSKSDAYSKGGVWFSDRGGGGKPAGGYEAVVSRTIDESKLKLATPELSDKYSTAQLKKMGYDGVKIPMKGENTYNIFNPEKLATQKSPTQSLINQAKKYKSAEEFGNSFNKMKSGTVTGVGELPLGKINKTQIKALTERGLPHTDTNLKVSDFKPGRKVTQPVEVFQKGNSYVVENGSHRLAQALANGDESIPVVFKRGEGKKYSSSVTDIYNQANKPVMGETPTVKPSKGVGAEQPSKTKTSKQYGDAKKMETALNQEYERVANATPLNKTEIQSIKELSEDYASRIKNSSSLVEAKQLNKDYMKLTNEYDDGTRKLTNAERDIFNSVDDAYMETRKTLRKSVTQSDSQTQGNIAKPKQPLSQPLDTTPAIARQVTSSKQGSQKLKPSQETPANRPALTTQKQPTPQGASKNPSTRLSSDSSLNDTTLARSKEIGNALGMSDADIARASDPTFEAAARSARSKAAKELGEAINTDSNLSKAAAKAQQDGSEYNYFAKKDENGRSIGIEQFDPRQHRIEAGFVRDKDGNVLGNHIKVDETGVQVNVGGEMTNLTSIIGDPSKIKNVYKAGETQERNIANAFGKNTPERKKLYDYTVANKIKNEANYKKELRSSRQDLNARTRKTRSARPGDVSKKDYNADISDYIEGKLSQADIKTKYGASEAQITSYKAETRKLYDTLLDRYNAEAAKYGDAQIPRRKDYLTHINELNGNQGFAGEMYGSLKNSVLGETETGTRGAVPTDIAGRTENFKPNRKWNPFAQERKGDIHDKDPFKAVDSYLEPTLYNIHMTESVARVRSVEAALRTASKFQKEAQPSAVKKELRTLFTSEVQNNNRVAKGLQEYANSIAGKTESLDRAIIDKSEGAAMALKGWQGLQKVGGRATILGNAQSVLAQTLGIPSTIASAGPKNFLKAIPRLVANDPLLKEADFIVARIAHTESKMRPKTQKAMDALGVPLREVEQQMVKLTWLAQHNKVTSQGMTGKAAITEASRLTERIVAGRGIADKPELYRSTAMNGLLQYTLEVSAQNKAFWKDFTPKQKATFVVAAFGMNAGMEQVTGFSPLPDFLGAGIETGKDFADKEDDRSGIKKTVGGLQRGADQVANMNPFVMAAVNMLPQNTRKDIFGDESSAGRFAGQAAPVKVVEKTLNAGVNLAEGKYRQARDNLVSATVPGGNQAKKTTQAAEMLNRGYAIDSGGNPTYAAPTGLYGKGKSLIFGPNSTKEAREYYDNKQSSVTGEGDKSTIAQSFDKRNTVSEIQTRRFADKVKTEQSDKIKEEAKKTGDYSGLSAAEALAETNKQRSEKLKNSLSGEDYAITQLSKDDRRKLLDSGGVTKAKLDGLDSYVKNKKKELGYSESKGDVGELPKGMNGYDVQTLERFAALDETGKDDLIRTEPDAEYKYALAQYERDKKLGKISKVEDIKKSNELAKAKVGKDTPKEIREFYSVSNTDIYEYVSKASDGKEVADKLIAYDKALYEAGITKYLKFKNGIAPTVARGRGGRGGRGGSRSDGGKSSRSLEIASLKRLNQLLGGTQKPVTSGNKVAVKKANVKKISVRA